MYLNKIVIEFNSQKKFAWKKDLKGQGRIFGQFSKP